MAPTVASPVPQPRSTTHPTRKDLATLQLNEEGRSTPLPQYEKTQSVPFNLTLQEDKRNPGQFQLVVNIDPDTQKRDGSPPKPAASKKLFANLQAFPSLGYDVSPLYQTQKSSPPMTPVKEEQEWSNLDAIPPDFLKKVVPDWEVTFQRKDSTASTQSRRLADIKARIKKNGKGFVVRLLKGSSSDTNEIAEVHLGQPTDAETPTVHELDSCQQVELDATEIEVSSSSQPTDATNGLQDVFEIGTSGEPGIQRVNPAPVSPTRLSPVPEWLRTTASDIRSRNSIAEESFSDAETLAQEIHSVGGWHDEDQPELEAVSTLPMRTTSVSSIVKTPTRGLSVVGQVKRISKGERARLANVRGKSARSALNRSDARKSFKRSSPSSSSSILSSSRDYSANTTFSFQDKTRASASRDIPPPNAQHHPLSSDEESLYPVKRKDHLKIRTDIPKSKSTNNSPINRRKKSPRHRKSSSSSSSVQFAPEPRHPPSPAWSEVDPSEELKTALEKAFGTIEDHDEPQPRQNTHNSIPTIAEPVDDDHVGEIPMLPGIELRSPPPPTAYPALKFWGMAFSSLSERMFEGINALRLRYGSEPPVPPGHVRVRWTCSCGDQLYDDFIERKPGAARALEGYLNRARPHSPNSPISSSGRTSTSSTMSTVFSSASRASTLATPASTYGGSSSWGKAGDYSKLSPTRLRSNNPFSVRIGTFVEEQWLLTCANEGRFTPKIVHIDVNPGKIRSDKDLALALREHYDQLNRRWMKWSRLRGLSTIEFVQFEVHRNRFADIRASPSMPPKTSAASPKAPSEHPYAFEPIDLMPPVGSTYLLHLFRHPSDYDGELITYLRSPKRRERLEFGMGWGINLVEGFLAQRVWSLIIVIFGVGSAVFAVLYSIGEGDVQGAFGVAGWFVTLAGLVLGGLQSWLE